MSQGFTRDPILTDDATLSAASHVNGATEYAIKTYVDTEIAAIPTPTTPGLPDVLTVDNTTGGADLEISVGDDIIVDDATASTIAGFDVSKHLISLDTATYPSLTELSYVKGVTSAIQDQLDALDIDPYHIGSYQSVSPVDGTTYYLGGSGYVMQTSILGKNIYPSFDGTIIAANIMWGATSTAGSNENISIYIRVNDTTDYLIATVGNTDYVKVFRNTGLSIVLTTSDFYMIKIVCPTWGTNPTSVGCQGTIYMLSS